MNIYQYITTEESSYQTMGVPIVDGMEWKMFEHVKLSTLYKNSKFSTGVDDGERPFKNIIRPILNVAYRSEGFDVKDIYAYVNDPDNYYKSFLVRKFHEKWARANDIDTFIDELVESYVDYGGALVKNVDDIKPEVVPFQRLAFCDQTDILTGTICEKHQYSVDQLLEFKGKWDDDAIDRAILSAKEEKGGNQSSKLKSKTPGKYIEVYELHGMFPEDWLDEDGDEEKYTNQLHIVTYIEEEDNATNEKSGVTLFKGKEKKGIYKFLSRDEIYGRALGFGGIEELFEPQIWTNYNLIQQKEMLDVASIMMLQTADSSFANKNKITDMEKGEVAIHKQDMPLTQVNVQPINMVAFEKAAIAWEAQARTTGSANDAQLGVSPTSGTPFALQELVTSTGQGIHEYRRGKIATFVGEVYRDWILPHLTKEINKGDKWLEDLDLEEMQFIAESVSTKKANEKVVNMVIKYFDKNGKAPTNEEIEMFKEVTKDNFLKSGNKKFIELVENELKKIPIDVSVNVAGKQKDLGKVASGLTNIFRQVFAAPEVLQDPGMSKLFNEIIESAGFSPVSFQGISNRPVQQPAQQPVIEQTNQLTK